MAKKKGKKKNKVKPDHDSDSSSGGEDIELPPVPPEEYFDKAEEVYLQPDVISEQQAREAIVEFVSQNCCYGKKPAEEMEITEIKTSSAYHYVLESFTEERKKEKRREPYYGQHIDSKEFGKKPKLWDIDISPPKEFINKVHEMEQPHSAKVKDCKDCDKLGEFDCEDCLASGKMQCTQCGGSGNVMRPDEAGVEQEVQCEHCEGSGEENCGECDGDGKLTCEDCDGHGEIKKYRHVTIIWKNHVAEFMSKSSEVPQDVVESADGTELFSQEHLRVPPLTSFYDEKINSESQRLVTDHNHLTSEGKILKQRHHLRVIPISDVTCKWDGNTFQAYVFGLDKRVYCPEYPQQCCFGCTII